MEEREIWCCGARGWTLAIGWLQIIWGTLKLLTLIIMGFAVFGMVKLEMDSEDEQELTRFIITVIWVMGVILVILSIIMAVILIRGCNNKNPKQLNIWIMYTKIALVIAVVVLFTGLFVTPLQQAPRKILSLCVEVSIQVFCIWVVGIHKSDIEASSGAVISYKA